MKVQRHPHRLLHQCRRRHQHPHLIYHRSKKKILVIHLIVSQLVAHPARHRRPPRRHPLRIRMTVMEILAGAVVNAQNFSRD